jgi:hypothetical protein
MSNAPHASSNVDGKPFCVIMHVPESLTRSSKIQDAQVRKNERDKFIAHIRQCISNGQAVLVKGWTPELHITFCVEDIELLRPTMTQKVQWQSNIILFTKYSLLIFNWSDAMVRAATFNKDPEDPDTESDDEDISIYNTSTLSEFIDLADDPNTCGNLLDLPCPHQEVPSWFR